MPLAVTATRVLEQQKYSVTYLPSCLPAPCPVSICRRTGLASPEGKRWQHLLPQSYLLLLSPAKRVWEKLRHSPNPEEKVLEGSGSAQNAQYIWDRNSKCFHPNLKVCGPRVPTAWFIFTPTCNSDLTACHLYFSCYLFTSALSASPLHSLILMWPFPMSTYHFKYLL